VSEVKDKIIKKLISLIEEAEILKKEITSYKDPRIDTWKMKSRKLLERIGEDRLAGQFNAAGTSSFNMMASERERFNYVLRVLEGRKNFLIVVKEDLELFEEEDAPELRKIKHKFEAGLDLKIIKGKYTQERERGGK